MNRKCKLYFNPVLKRHAFKQMFGPPHPPPPKKKWNWLQKHNVQTHPPIKMYSYLDFAGVLRGFCRENPNVLIPDPDHCSRYYNCSEPATVEGLNVPFKQECKYPRLFGYGATSCQLFTEVQCQRRFEPKAPCKYLQFSKISLKRPLSKRPKIGFQDQLSLNEGQTYCRMLQGEHSSILSTFNKIPLVIKIFVLSIFEWKFYVGFTVHIVKTGTKNSK